MDHSANQGQRVLGGANEVQPTHIACHARDRARPNVSKHMCRESAVGPVSSRLEQADVPIAWH